MSPEGTETPVAAESELSEQFRRLMRWYPKRWRVENEDAMLGALLDQAEDEDRDHPTDRERWALLRSGIAQRFAFPVRASRLRIVPLGAGAVLSVFYACFIIWAPETRFPGSIGPFANPSVLTCVLLVVAFVASLVSPGKLASLLSICAAIAEVLIGIIAAFHPTQGSSPWEGPSPSTVALFAGIAVLGGASLRHGWTLTAGSLIVAALVIGALVSGFVEAELGYFSPLSTIMTACAALAICIAIGIVVVNRVRARRSA